VDTKASLDDIDWEDAMAAMKISVGGLGMKYLCDYWYIHFELFNDVVLTAECTVLRSRRTERERETHTHKQTNAETHKRTSALAH
jgi:hypothetical protein